AHSLLPLNRASRYPIRQSFVVLPSPCEISDLGAPIHAIHFFARHSPQDARYSRNRQASPSHTTHCCESTAVLETLSA
ncbi:unnamed protein product, partial [Closterium sp. Naga37s-1]